MNILFKVNGENVGLVESVYIKKKLSWVKMVTFYVLIVGKFYGVLYYLPVKRNPVPGF